VFDARCLPNPYYVAELKPLTGRDAPVIDYLQQHSDVEEMVTDIAGYLRRWLPRHSEENRSYFTVAIGCTGGQHRSVALTETLAKTLAEEGWHVSKRHRELERRAEVSHPQTRGRDA